MTVSYQYDVASTSSGGFIRLLFKWKGSVWKLVYTELLLLAVAYGFLSLLYRQALTEPQKRVFELLVYYCSTFMEMIPLSFMLGFYVTFTATRWWSQYMAIPWPDRVMNVLMMYVPGQDDEARMLRRTLMRYLNLSLILVLRSISKAVKRRFPTKDHLIEAGFMTKLEMEVWQSIPSTEFNTFWVPCTWFINLLREARNECRITDAQGVKLILEEFNDFRSKCGLLWSYDWISIPLVYTQVVTLATYSFFGAALFGRQYIHSPDPIIDKRHHFDFYVPVFTVIQYFLYMGLLKVAEQLINPFGDDEEDFEVNWIIDRHFKVSYLGVDTLDGPALPLVKDSYFHKADYQLPYTAASVSYKKKTYRGSVAYMHVPHEQREMVVPEVSEEDDEDTPSNAEEGGEDQDPGGPLSKKHSSSVWTLLGRRTSSSASLAQQQLDAESGLLQANKDSTLHVYFKGGDGEDSKEKHLLKPPEERRRPGRLGSEPSAGVHHQRSFLREFFHAKPARRVQAWTGADGDYGSPPKRPRKLRSKVSFSADTSAGPTGTLLYRSRSTSDLAAALETARKEALISSLKSLRAAKPRRKSLESSQTAVSLVAALRRSKSLPELNISDLAYKPLLVPQRPSPPKKPVRTRTSLTPQSSLTPKVSQLLQLALSPRPPALTLRKSPAPQKPPVPETPKPPPAVPSIQVQAPVSSPPMLAPPPALAAPPAPATTSAIRETGEAAVPKTTADYPLGAPTREPAQPAPHAEESDSSGSPVQVTLRKPRVRLPRLVIQAPGRAFKSIFDTGEGSSDEQSKSEAVKDSASALAKPPPTSQPLSETTAAKPRPRLRVRVVPEPEIIPIEPTVGDSSLVADKDTEMVPPGTAPEPVPEPPPSPPPEPPDQTTSPVKESDHPERPRESGTDSDDDKTEFVVVIRDKTSDRPKQLMIKRGPSDRAGSVDSLLGDPRPKTQKRRSSFESPASREDMQSLVPVFRPQRDEPDTQAPDSPTVTSGGVVAAPVDDRPSTSSGRDSRRHRRRRRSSVRRLSSVSHEGSPTGGAATLGSSQESLNQAAAAAAAAAAPVHRRVPSDVLMRWQNLMHSDSGDETDRPPPPRLLELPGAVPAPPPGHVRQLSRAFAYRSTTSSSSSVTVRGSTTSLSRAASKAEAFLASEKRES
ncbi:uncharacterized protein LOC144170073 isoform X2 [Haemaphysalis longicornis]